MPKPVIDYKKCTNCGNCIDVCPMDVFEKEGDKVVSILKEDKEKLVEELSRRIYGIRNAIAHSKSEFSIRITPNAEILNDFDADIFIVSEIARTLIKKFSSNFDNL